MWAVCGVRCGVWEVVSFMAQPPPPSHNDRSFLDLSGAVLGLLLLPRRGMASLREAGLEKGLMGAF